MENHTRRPDLAARNRDRHVGTYLYEDAIWMRKAYLEDNLSLRELAAEAGCSLRTIARWMKAHRIPSRSVSEGARLLDRTGDKNPNWRGAQICPSCGGQKRCRAETCASCRCWSGERNPNWRDRAIGYGGAHDRAKALFGPASSHICVSCDGQATDWAYTHTDPAEMIDPDLGLPYSADVSHYMPLCVRCHKRFDVGRVAGGDFRESHCVNGHAMSGDNLRITGKGIRVCRECSRGGSARYRRLRQPK